MLHCIQVHALLIMLSVIPVWNDIILSYSSASDMDKPLQVIGFYPILPLPPTTLDCAVVDVTIGCMTGKESGRSGVSDDLLMAVGRELDAAGGPATWYNAEKTKNCTFPFNCALMKRAIVICQYFDLEKDTKKTSRPKMILNSILMQQLTLWIDMLVTHLLVSSNMF